MPQFTPATLERIRTLLNVTRRRSFREHLLPVDQRRKDYEEREKRKAAVVIPLMNVEGEASILFTVRSSSLPTHSGQVSFPGGHVDADETVDEAARRELMEETRIAIPDGSKVAAVANKGAGFFNPILGHLVVARAVTGTLVHPVVVFLGDFTQERVRDAGRQNAEEVAEAFALPVSELCDPANHRRQDFPNTRFRAPRFSVEARKHPDVWGLTAFFTDVVLADALAPALGLNYESPLSTKADVSVLINDKTKS